MNTENKRSGQSIIVQNYSIEEQEAHFGLTQDAFLHNDRAKYITQQRKREICPDCGCVAISIGNNNILCDCSPQW